MKPVDSPAASIKPNSMVIIVLHSPREKCWGLLDDITPAGVFLRGLDLNAFDSWLQATAHEEQFLGFGDLFFPMWRVERISRDEGAGELLSLSEQAERRTGRSIGDLIEAGR
ncbi:MAG TPA: hypothetical protein VJT50_12925 [Pyrinomonadaceae bacterium]|nr:hypothetical protein [Pyrinomonadaceae bacterium]